MRNTMNRPVGYHRPTKTKCQKEEKQEDICGDLGLTTLLEA